MSSKSSDSSLALPILMVAGASLAALAVAWAVRKALRKRHPAAGSADAGTFVDWEEDGEVRAQFI